jgi:hypothetical protein
MHEAFILSPAPGTRTGRPKTAALWPPFEIQSCGSVTIRSRNASVRTNSCCAHFFCSVLASEASL